MHVAYTGDRKQPGTCVLSLLLPGYIHYRPSIDERQELQAVTVDHIPVWKSRYVKII
jgi:hypothetical protein